MISVRMLPARAGQAMGGDLAPAATATILATPPVGMAARCLTDPFTMTTPRLAAARSISSPLTRLTQSALIDRRS